MPVCLENHHFCYRYIPYHIRGQIPNIFFSGIYLWQFRESGKLRNKLYNLKWKYGDKVWGFTDGDTEKVFI